MRVSFGLIALVLLGGCLDGQGPNHPAILLSANNQAHILVVQGSESGLDWSDIGISIDGDLSCGISAPQGGGLQPGQTIHILSDEGAQCLITVSYQGVEVGEWTFAPPVNQSLTESASQTTTVQTTSQTAGGPP